MLEFIDYLLLLAVQVVIFVLLALAYYLDQRAFKVETISKFEKLMLAWEGRLTRVAGKFEGVEAPEINLQALLLQSIFSSKPVQGLIENALGGLEQLGSGKVSPPKKKTEE